MNGNLPSSSFSRVRPFSYKSFDIRSWQVGLKLEQEQTNSLCILKQRHCEQFLFMQLKEQAQQTPDADQDEPSSSTALDYSKQLMQPEWMIDMPENLQSDW